MSKSSGNSNFDAIRAMARNMKELLSAATVSCAQAGGVGQSDGQNELVGALLPVREQLVAALAQYDAIMTLHKLCWPNRR